MRFFELHPKAFTDIDEIATYIGEDSPAAASRLVDEFYSAMSLLVSFPHQGRWRRDLTDLPIRFKRVREYLIAYVADEKPLWVIAIMHGHRSPRTMAKILKSRES